MASSRLCFFLCLALHGLPSSLCSSNKGSPQDVSIPSDASSKSNPKTHVLPLIPHHEHRRRLLEEESGRRLDAGQIAALYNGIGTHYIDLWCGTPPQRQTVIVDTGSGVTAFPCSGCKDCGAPEYHIDSYFIESDSSTFQEVTCGSCETGSCKHATGQCELSRSYREGSSWRAYEAIDNCYVGGPHNAPLLSVDFDIGDLNPFHANAFSTPLTFGCQKHLTGMFEEQLADGIMGMDDAATSYWRELYNNGQIETQQFALCFSRPHEITREGTVAGAMTLGGVDPRLDDTPLVYSTGAASGRSGFFSVKVRHIYLRTGHGGHESAAYSDIKTESLDVPPGSFIVDSGTTNTYVNSRFAKSFRLAFKTMTGKDYNYDGVSLTEEELAKLPTILFQFEGDTIQNSDLPADAIGLAGALDSDHPLDVILAIPPSHYMEMDNNGRYYTGFHDDDKNGGGVIGANAMMGHNVFFDMDNKRIGWAESMCDYSELLAESGYTDILSTTGTSSSVGVSRSSSENDKKRPTGSEHDQTAPAEDLKQTLAKLTDACDSLACQGGSIAVTVMFILGCFYGIRRCCCPKKLSSASYDRAEQEVEMNGISTSYKDEEGFKDEPDDDDDDEGYGDINP